MADRTTPPSQPPIGLRKVRPLFRPGRDPTLRQEAQRLARGAQAALQKAGVELDRFEDLKRRNDAQIREALAKSRAAADERASAMPDTIARQTENWVKANRLREALSPGVHLFSLSTPDDISVTGGLVNVAENFAPWATSAEVILDRTTTDDDATDEEVIFKYRWQNQTGQDGLFTVTALLGVKAYVDVTADGWVLPPWLGGSYTASRLYAVAVLRITEIAADGQVIDVPCQPSQGVGFIDLEVEGFWGEGNIKGTDVITTNVLQYRDLLVPSNARLDLDVVCHVSWVATDGGGQFVAAGFGRHLTGPGVFILQW